jgi:quercetin dioxygenase-like cupin family protein
LSPSLFSSQSKLRFNSVLAEKLIQIKGGNMKTHIFAIFVVAAALYLGIPTTWAQHSAHVMITPSELKWSDVPSLPPGATIAVIEGPMNEPVPFTVRIRFPANYKLPAHWHPAVERITVLSGTFNMGVGDELDPQKTTPLVPGSVAIMQPKTHHFALTKEETVVQLNGVGPWGITYINPKDDPRKK